MEFDAELATTDVLYDLAFLVMDLWARGLRHEANVVVNTYFDHATFDGAIDDEQAFCLLPVLLAVRATVRAHVAAAEHDVDRAHEYLSLALGFTESARPRLVAIGGGSGGGGGRDQVSTLPRQPTPTAAAWPSPPSPTAP